MPSSPGVSVLFACWLQITAVFCSSTWQLRSTPAPENSLSYRSICWPDQAPLCSTLAREKGGALLILKPLLIDFPLMRCPNPFWLPCSFSSFPQQPLLSPSCCSHMLLGLESSFWICLGSYHAHEPWAPCVLASSSPDMG